MSSWIQLHGYYPAPYTIYFAIEFITAVHKNTTNPNSRGSVVWLGEADFMVSEEPHIILEMINARIAP